jgi:lipopolysaccharide biosynthesis glycosyltransferase
MIEIGFAVDEYMEDCAYVAIHSMLKRATQKVSIIIFYEAGSKCPGLNWSKKLKQEGFNFELRHQDIDLKALKYCKDIFNSRANYLRIYMPRYAKTHQMIYSDVDVVFTDDICKLSNYPLNGATIALIAFGKRLCKSRDEKERKALLLCGHKEEDQYFSSGFAIINVRAYIDNQIINKAEKIAAEIPELLSIQDQTLWNCSFSSNEIVPIPDEWCQVAPNSKNDIKPEYYPGIIHFTGTPKPWDLFAEFLHMSFKDWYLHAKKAKLGSQMILKYFKVSYIRKYLRTQKQYARYF